MRALGPHVPEFMPAERLSFSNMGQKVGRLRELGPHVPEYVVQGLSNPQVLSPVRQSIFNSLLITATSIVSGVYLMRTLPKEKDRVWQVLGWFGVTGAWYGMITGVSGIVYHFVPDSKKDGDV